MNVNGKSSPQAGNGRAHGHSSSVERLEPRSPHSRAEDEQYPVELHDDGVEMTLLGHGARRPEVLEEQEEKDKMSKPLSTKDKKAMVLLIILYLIQGVPLGLALGSVPFLLREHLTYKQLSWISLSSYPYSLKLLWSPIVDSMFDFRVGRRKSWIIPMQIIIGTMMFWISNNAAMVMENPDGHVLELTVTWTSLVFFAATQDIAVDGWALTLLSDDAKAYASTAQTVGLNCGYFASYTVFLAFNSESFAAKYGIPRLTLSAYLKFWCVVCYSVTVWLIFFKKEEPVSPDDPDMRLKSVYKSMWKLCKLEHFRRLFLVHLFAKITWQAHDSITSLKLVEKGLPKEDLAAAVLVDFPFQLIAGWLAGRWSRGNKPLRPWLYAYWARAGFVIVAMIIVATFPGAPLGWSWFIMFVSVLVLNGFAGTIQFVGVSAFHTRISDPTIGGTYMTMLNTASNLGGTWPGPFVFLLVDAFTDSKCRTSTGSVLTQVSECVSEVGKHQCKNLSGHCDIVRDGYYTVSCICLVLGVTVWLLFVRPTALKLQALPFSKWRINQPRDGLPS
ncbi:related to putative acetyl-coenzyme A transporter [Serendipita indica DSM 11827]|uniref:Related to putative acetyl-coenzyme A transporter n=1 Tax=Serendipita indica (strain DSM 11827) TaxID=1109443 RepID=G4TFU1_SERID|nr:related to putative acetyl-coenzyme A transporter [Serendipita indica DSM 11827]